MTDFLKSLSIGGCLVLSAMSGVFAQTRSCDMAPTLITPAEGAFIAPYAHFDLRIQIKNNGPDDLLAGDTVYYNTSMDFSQSYTPYVLNQDIEAGDSTEVFLMEVANNNENPADETALFCVKVKTFPNQIIEDTTTTNNNSCHTITFGGIDPPTAIDEWGHQNKGFTLYPSPANHILYIKTNDAQTEDITGVLTTISGRILKTFTWTAGKIQATLDISHLPAGVYIVSLQTKAQKKFLKFVKK